MSVSFDCDKVLTSKASRVFNALSLADVGFVYFVAGIVGLVLNAFFGLPDNTLLILFYFSVCGVPFILFSIFYQWIKVKKWCPLCLSVVGVILLEICLFMFYPNKFLESNFVKPLLLLLFSCLTSVLILYFFKRLLQEQVEAFENRIETLKIKRNPIILTTLFNRGQQVIIPKKHQISIGNKQSHTVITTVLNPKCQPCAKMVENIITLLEEHPQEILWQIRFDGIEWKEYHPVNQIQLHLIQLCNNEKEDSVKLQIIKDWYRSQSVYWFAKKYPINEFMSETITDFAEQNADNKQLNVKKVPTIWINNREFPKEYSVKDIPFLLADLNLLLKLTK